MRTVQIKLYQFNELNPEAQKQALDKHRDWNVEGGIEWWNAVYDDAKTIGKILGIDITEIYFSGFSSQGDGACFEGSYAYGKDSARKIRDYAPKDTELHRIADRLQDIQRRHCYALAANVKHRGHYYHHNCTEIEVDGMTDDDDNLQDTLRDFMQWIYRQLEVEYEYLTSDEVIVESLVINKIEFTEDGKLSPI